MRILHMTSRRTRIYEGKAKILYEGPEPGTVIVHFKDDATAFDAQKKAVIEGKGVLNQRISEYIFSRLNEVGIPTHFMRSLNLREQLVREVEIIPLEVIVRNVAAGSLAKRLGLEEGTPLPRSIIEFCYKNDALHDPMVSEDHITAFGWAAPQEIDEISPDSCRLWDTKTNDKMDKDRFRRDMGGLVEAYQEVAKRLGIITENEKPERAKPKLVKSDT
jgi:phosphoribosylaminoimidazole-succinocarboxamide synthase